MAKVIIPAPSTYEKEALARRGLDLVESITEEAFRQVIVDYLDTHNVLHLATCMQEKDEPRSTAVEYFNNGLTVYILSERGGKIANIKKNPKVSYSIADPYRPHEDFFEYTGLQVWGIASMFRKNEDPEKFQEIFQHSHYMREPEKLEAQGVSLANSPFNFNVITIEPYRMRYLDLKKGFRNVVLKIDDSKGR